MFETLNDLMEKYDKCSRDDFVTLRLLLSLNLKKVLATFFSIDFFEKYIYKVYLQNDAIIFFFVFFRLIKILFDYIQLILNII